MANFLSLPPEIKDTIFDFFCLRLLKDRTLRLNGLAISLVCQDFLPYGRSMLYKSVRISRDAWESHETDLIADEKTLNHLHYLLNSPGIGRHIQKLYFDLGVLYSIHANPHAYNSETSEYGTWDLVGRGGSTLNSSLGQLADLLRNCAHLKELNLVSHSPQHLLDFLAALPRDSSLQCLTWREHTPGAVYGRILPFPDGWTSKLAKLMRRHRELRSFEIINGRQYPSYDPKFQEYERAFEFQTFTDGGPALHSCAIPTLKLDSKFSDQYLRIFDASNLVHLTLGLSMCSLRVLKAETFSKVSKLCLTGSDNSCFFEHGTQILSQFPALETLEYNSETIRGEGNTIQSRSPHLGAIFNALPPSIISLELVDNRYPYELHVSDVDTLWTSRRLKNLSSICMTRLFSLMPIVSNDHAYNEYLWIGAHYISDLLQGKSLYLPHISKPSSTFAYPDKYPRRPRRAQIHLTTEESFEIVKKRMDEDRLRE